VRAVNLLPSKKEERERTRRKPNLVALGGVVAAVAVTAVMAMLFLNASGAVTEQQAEVDNLRVQLGAIPPPAPRDTSGDALTAEKDGRLNALAAALSNRVAWDRVLREISLVTPDDIWFTSLQASSPAASGGAAPAPEAAPSGGGFSITGRTYSHDSVARMLSRLELVPNLDQVKLEKSVLSSSQGKTLVEFTISATVRPKGATS
jgi:Tfp pilus assembly protein PilN